MTNFFVLDAKFGYTFDDDEGAADIVEFLDAVVEHLQELEATDVFVVSDENEQTFLVSQVVSSIGGDSIETVVGKGMGLLRTAFHTCNAKTPAWPTPTEAVLNVSVSPVEVPSEAEPASELELV